MIYRFGQFLLDDEIFALRRDGAEVPLRPQALDLLLYLLKNADRVVTKGELLEKVWRGVTVSENTLPQTILAIRRVLDEAPGEELIQTVRGRGYRFAANVDVSAREQAKPSLSPARSGLIGRGAILERFDEIFERAKAGNGNLMLVSGEPGIGKTRLLHELGARACWAGARVLEARCPDGAAAPDLWMWVQLLRAYAHGTATPDTSEAATLATELLKPAGAGNMPGSSDGGFVAFDRVAEVFRRATHHQPLALSIDDLHNADTASLLLLKFFASTIHGSRLTLIASYRDVGTRSSPVLARTLGALVREDPQRRIALERLTRDEVDQLAREVLERPADDALVSRLIEKTNGNPLLVTQMLQALSGEAGVQKGDTSALLAVSEMKEAILAQVEVLSERTRDLLRPASVCGIDLVPRHVARMLATDTKSLLAPLDEALRARVLSKASDGRYRFTHVLVRDVLYRSLTLAERAELHEALGASLLDAGEAEPALLHIERALRDLDALPTASALVPSEEPRERATALLSLLRAKSEA
jgi:DNA-binding winged helix-turn-helix (wHTH) protein